MTSIPPGGASRYDGGMSYIVTALSSSGQVEDTHETAEAALDAAMRLEARGNHLVRIKDTDGNVLNVTQLHRQLHGIGIGPDA